MNEKKHRGEDEDLEAVQEDAERELEQDYEDFEAALGGERHRKKREKPSPQRPTPRRGRGVGSPQHQSRRKASLTDQPDARSQVDPQPERRVDPLGGL